jgi:hypothetical protein
MAWKFFNPEGQVIGTGPSRGWNFYNPDGEVQASGSGGGGSQWSVLTNGDATTPELIFADGDVIMTETLG